MSTQTNNINPVEWSIDRTPSTFHIAVYSDNNVYLPSRDSEVEDTFHLHYTELTRIRTFNHTIEFPTRFDDFIPFEPLRWDPIKTTIKEFSVSEEEKNCCICYEIREISDVSQINCSHKFCGTCIIEHISRNYNCPCCPLCRVKITHIIFQHQKYQDKFIKVIQNS